MYSKISPRSGPSVVGQAKSGRIFAESFRTVAAFPTPLLYLPVKPIQKGTDSTPQD